MRKNNDIRNVCIVFRDLDDILFLIEENIHVCNKKKNNFVQTLVI